MWILPGLAVLAHHAARARGLRRWAGWSRAAAILAAFAAWPDFWAAHTVLIPAGLIWYAPASYSRSATTHGSLSTTGTGRSSSSAICTSWSACCLWRSRWSRAQNVAPPGSLTSSADREAKALT